MVGYQEEKLRKPASPVDLPREELLLSTYTMCRKLKAKYALLYPIVIRGP